MSALFATMYMQKRLWVSWLFFLWVLPVLAEPLREHPLWVFQGSEEAFAAALEQSKAQSEEPVVRDVAVLLYGIRDVSGDYLQRHIEEVQRMKKSYPVDDRLDVHFLIAVAEARHALSLGNLERAEGLLKDAWWSFPGGGPMVLQLVDEIKSQQYFQTLQLDWNASVRKADGGVTTWRELLGEHKGIMLNLWASWCPYCMSAMPAMNQQAAIMRQQGVALVGLNVEARDRASKAQAVSMEYQMQLPWLVDDPDGRYHRLFRAQVLPRWLLLNREGRIVHAGHPLDPRWTEWLQALQ